MAEHFHPDSVTQKINDVTAKYIDYRQYFQPRWRKTRNLEKFVSDQEQQFTPEQRNEAKNRSQFLLVVNLLKKQLRNLIGTLGRNRTENRVVSEQGDEEKAEIMNKVLKYINETKNNITDLKIRQFTEGCFSFTGSFLKQEWGTNLTTGWPQILKTWVPSVNILYDPNSITYELDPSDCSAMMETDFYNIDTLYGMFKEDRDQIKKAHESFEGKDPTWKARLANWVGLSTELDDFRSRVGNRYRLIIMEYAQNDVEHWVEDRNTGERFSGEERTKEIELLVIAEPDRYVIGQSSKLNIHTMATIPALQLLLQDHKNIAQTGYYRWFRYATDNLRTHVINDTPFFDDLQDPQRIVNKTVSTGLDNHAKAGNPKFFKEGGGQLDESVKQDILDPDIRLIDLPTNAKITPFQFQGTSQEAMMLFEQMKKTLEDIPQMGGAILGQGSSEDNASLFNLKIQQGSLNLEPLYLNLRKTHRFMDKDAIIRAQVHMTDPEVLHIRGDNDIKSEPVLINGVMRDGSIKHDLSEGSYDIRLDTGQHSSTMKERYFVQLMQMVRVMPPEYSSKIWDLIVEQTDMGHITTEMTERIKQQILFQTKLEQMSILGSAQAAKSGAEFDQKSKAVELEIKASEANSKRKSANASSKTN